MNTGNMAEAIAGRPDSIPAPIGMEAAGIEFQVPEPVPISQVAPDAEVAWQWFGYLARGCVTLLTGLWKAGKTTLVSHVLNAFGEGGEVAGRVEPSKVLVVSEESRTLWARRRESLGIGDHVFLSIRPFKGRPNRQQWEKAINQIAAWCEAGRFDVVVFDALANLWPVPDENDAAKVTAALAPLQQITEAGASVLLCHHPRKSDGNEGMAARGSGALPAFVDVILELRRYRPNDHDDTRRTLTAYGRFDETPNEQIIQLTDCGYRVVGNKCDARRVDRLDVVMSIIGTVGLTVEEIRERWPGDAPSPKPGLRTLRGDLQQPDALNRWERTGSGAKNDPHRFRLMQKCDSGKPNLLDAGIESDAPRGDSTAWAKQ